MVDSENAWMIVSSFCESVMKQKEEAERVRRREEEEEEEMVRRLLQDEEEIEEDTGGRIPLPHRRVARLDEEGAITRGDCVPLAAWKPIGGDKAFPATGDAVSLATGDDGGAWSPPAPRDISSGEEETSPQR